MTHFPNFGHEKNFPEVLILGPKIPNSHHFGHKRNFSQKRAPSILCLLNTTKSMQKIRKKVMSQSIL